MLGLTGALWAFLFLTAADAPGARIGDLQVRLEGREVKTSFVLEGAFDDAFRERLQSGLPSGFSIRLKLLRDHKRWLDRELESTDFQVTAMYNAVNREYLVNYKLNGKLTESRVEHDLVGAQRAMTRFEDIAVFTLDDVDDDWQFLVKARASLGSRQILWLIPTTDTTDWAESRKFRIP